MSELIDKQDVLDTIFAKMEKTDKPDVVLGLATAMSVVKKMGELAQEPCTDAISRQAAINQIRSLKVSLCGKTNVFSDDAKDSVINILNDLPPVKPEQKIGHWIELDNCSNSGYYCSECQKRVVKEGWSDTVKIIKYCPNCGSRMMQEVEE